MALVLTGCAPMKNHDVLANQMQSAQQTGGIPAALRAFDVSTQSDSDKTELLYNLEKRELMRLDRQHKKSTMAFPPVADSRAKEWEDSARTHPQKLLGTMSAATTGEQMKRYESQDSEKTWLTTRLASDRVAADDLDTARVDIERMHEREALMAVFRESGNRCCRSTSQVKKRLQPWEKIERLSGRNLERSRSAGAEKRPSQRAQPLPRRSFVRSRE